MINDTINNYYLQSKIKKYCKYYKIIESYSIFITKTLYSLKKYFSLFSF
jgi:hypothetical protein